MNCGLKETYEELSTASAGTFYKFNLFNYLPMYESLCSIVTHKLGKGWSACAHLPPSERITFTVTGLSLLQVKYDDWVT